MGHMSCSRMQKQMMPFVDGRLKASEQREMEAHLAACPACRMRVNEFRAVSGLLDELPQIEPSGAFGARARGCGAGQAKLVGGVCAFAASGACGFDAAAGDDLGWVAAEQCEYEQRWSERADCCYRSERSPGAGELRHFGEFRAVDGAATASAER